MRKSRKLDRGLNSVSKRIGERERFPNRYPAEMVRNAYQGIGSEYETKPLAILSWLKRHFICARILLKLACVMPK